MTATANTAPFFKRHIALPNDHGSWVFLFSPLLIGLFAAGQFHLSSLILIVAALAGFLARQPLTMLVKIYSGRRTGRDLPAAWFWSAAYGLLGLLALSVLLQQGYSFLVLLALPGLPVFLWHLLLVSRRHERRQIGIELIACGVLALAAPAAYWVGTGQPDALGWWLWALAWLQSAASIVYAYLRLEQRELKEMPALKTRWMMGRRALAYTSFNLLCAAILSGLAIIPPLVWLPFLLQWAETLYGITNPALGLKPTQVGIRQLIVSSIFTLLFILTWRR